MLPTVLRRQRGVTGIGRRAWASGGLADRMELRIAPALETLRALAAAAEIDLVFMLFGFERGCGALSGSGVAVRG
jgi:hypothetical protein